MCGIVCIVGLQGSKVDPEVIQRMANVLHHRGPDDQGEYLSGAVGFGFRRLAILDQTIAAHQPMVSEDGQLAMVFNGEIYNFIELRQELEALGHAFRSSGDTEVLLHAYQEWGSAMLPRLNGMWAVLIYDHRSKTLFGARDRFGIKPLYCYKTRDFALFASEIKAIRASPYYYGEPNWKRAAQLLLSGRLEYVENVDETFYSNIVQIPAASAFEIDANGQTRTWRYWSIHHPIELPTDNPSRVFFEILRDAVRLQMRSDTAAAVSLSGGMDSTTIVSLMANIRSHSKGVIREDDFHAFSYITPEFDETKFLADTVQHTGVSLHTVQVDPLRVWDKLERILWYHDEPVHSYTALVGYEVYARAAAEGIKVMLCGAGADEYLAGYPAHFPDYWRTLLRDGKVRQAWSEINAFCQAYGGDAGASFRTALITLMRAQFGRLSLYRALSRQRRFRRLCAHPWFTQDLKNALELNKSKWLEPSLDAALQRDLEFSPLPLYLRIEDRNAMAHAIEARVPFLDHRLVSLLFRLSPQLKMRGPWTKYLLREAMRNHIPESVRNRPKEGGFPTPVAHCFRNALYEPLSDLLASQAVRDRGIYNVSVIRHDLHRHRSGEIDVSDDLFNIAQWESWLGFAGRPHSYKQPSAHAYSRKIVA